MRVEEVTIFEAGASVNFSAACLEHGGRLVEMPARMLMPGYWRRYADFLARLNIATAPIDFRICFHDDSGVNCVHDRTALST